VAREPRVASEFCAHNNAGLVGYQAPIVEVELEAWNRLRAVNLTGTWLCLKHEILHMRAHGGGAI
jgi:NAD(P)-dependent dehydrogenase (short-subunit alcohol dehydrogenase family)